MKLVSTLVVSVAMFAGFSAVVADEIKSENFGAAEVFYSFQPPDSDVATLTLVASIPETNNSLRGLKNFDQRRLSKLGQLVYQCKLMLYKGEKEATGLTATDPVLISKNYSLFTGVDLTLADNEKVSIHAEALQVVDEASLFSPTFGNGDAHKKTWATLGGNSAVSLKQFDVNLLNGSNFIETSESVDIVARFPVFQTKKPVSQWSYNFDLKDFKHAIRHIDENCTPIKLMELMQQKT